MNIYLVCADNYFEWEDAIMFLSEEIAINYSKKHPGIRVEIFTLDDLIGYSPSYNYYKNGNLIDSAVTTN